METSGVRKRPFFIAASDFPRGYQFCVKVAGDERAGVEEHGADRRRKSIKIRRDVVNEALIRRGDSRAKE